MEPTTELLDEETLVLFVVKHLKSWSMEEALLNDNPDSYEQRLEEGYDSLNGLIRDKLKY